MGGRCVRGDRWLVATKEGSVPWVRGRGRERGRAPGRGGNRVVVGGLSCSYDSIILLTFITWIGIFKAGKLSVWKEYEKDKEVERENEESTERSGRCVLRATATKGNKLNWAVRESDYVIEGGLTPP